MKRVIIFVSYLIYFVYGFLFSCGYLGGNALSNAIRNDKNVTLPLIGSALLILLFISSLFWVFNRKYSERGRYLNSTSLILLILVPLLVPPFWLIGETEARFSDFFGVSFGLFLTTSPLWICVLLWRRDMDAK